MRGFMGVLVLGSCVVGGVVATAQVEVDRTLQRVNGVAIMASDVREARVLKLVPEASGSDEAVLTALENRLLMLQEVSHVEAAPPSTDAIAERRRAWVASWPPGTDLHALTAQVGASDQALNGWFRDDLLIDAYLNQRFGQQADAARASRIADWIAGLRRRANIKVQGTKGPKDQRSSDQVH